MSSRSAREGARTAFIGAVVLAALIGAAVFIPASALAPASTGVIIRRVTEATVVDVEEIGAAQTQQLGIPVAAAYVTFSDGRRFLAVGVWTGQGWDLAHIPLTSAKGGDP